MKKRILGMLFAAGLGMALIVGSASIAADNDGPGGKEGPKGGPGEGGKGKPGDEGGKGGPGEGKGDKGKGDKGKGDKGKGKGKGPPMK